MTKIYMNQGQNASLVFAGKSTNPVIQEVYGKSAELFVSIIKERLTPQKYVLTDFGSHDGELLQDLLVKLPKYTFKTVGVDIKRSSNVDVSIQSDLKEIPLADNSSDIGFCRYVLAWNSYVNQEKILLEMSRISKNLLIIQSAGPSQEDEVEYNSRLNSIFLGDKIPSLKRKTMYFPSKKRMEGLFTKIGLTFDCVDTKRVENITKLFVEKFNLYYKDELLFNEVMGDLDYITRSTWVIQLA